MSILTELSKAKNRKEFKVIAYLDQVYPYTKQVYINMLNENTDYVIAFTEDWKDCIHWQGLEKQCFVLPHGINTGNYYPIPKKLARLYFGFNQDDFLILNLNRNQPRKRWDICIQAFAEVVKQKPDEPIKLVIATALNGAWNLIQLLQREFKKRDMLPMLQFLVYMVDQLKHNNILWGVGRGSSVSSYILYLIGVHKIDSVKYNLDYKEFLR